MQSNATLSETRFYHSETITPAIYDFVVMGGLVFWLGAKLSYNAARGSFEMEGTEGERHTLALAATDSYRLGCHWSGFLARHAAVLSELHT